MSNDYSIHNLRDSLTPFLVYLFLRAHTHTHTHSLFSIHWNYQRFFSPELSTSLISPRSKINHHVISCCFPTFPQNIDRAAGKTAYAIENNLNGFTGTIDKTIPALLEVGRQAAVSGSEIARGSKAIYEDVVGFVDDVTVENTINSAGKRFAATKPTSTFREVTASVNDPNQLGKL
jgi:hypothetical protein